MTDKYEALELIVKTRADGVSWFDVIADLIAADCQGSETEPCTCGLESLGGSSGTLDQCYRYQGIADDLVTVKSDDLELVLHHLALRSGDTPQALVEATTRLSKEINWWDDYLATQEDIDEEEE